MRRKQLNCNVLQQVCR